MRSRTAAAVAVVGLFASLAGCGIGTRGGTATNNVSACAPALPLAGDAVGHKGTIIRIHRLRRGQAGAILRELGHPRSRPRRHPRPPAPDRPGQKEPKRCLIVYRGPYARGSVPLARNERGLYAVILARARHPQLVAVVLADRLPPDVRP